MKKFRFTLEAVMAQEKRTERQCRDVLAKIRQVIEALLQHQAELSTQIQACIGEAASDGIDLFFFKRHKVYLEELCSRRKELEKQIEETRLKEEQAIDRLKQSKQKIAVLENIKEKQYREYLENIKRQEEKELEALILLKYT